MLFPKLVEEGLFWGVTLWMKWTKGHKWDCWIVEMATDKQQIDSDRNRQGEEGRKEGGIDWGASKVWLHWLIFEDSLWYFYFRSFKLFLHIIDNKIRKTHIMFPRNCKIWDFQCRFWVRNTRCKCYKNFGAPSRKRWKGGKEERRNLFGREKGDDCDDSTMIEVIGKLHCRMRSLMYTRHRHECNKWTNASWIIALC